MGIPFYYHYLTKNYDNIISYKLPEAQIDMFCLDYNGIIHPVCQSVPDKNNVFEPLWEHTKDLIKRVKPIQTIVCIDGVAPLAKIMQQRKRRYMSLIERANKGNWDSNHITHGTPFMKRLSNYIKERCSEDGILFNHENGEAEHKIMEMIHKEEYNNKTVLIHGLDADLILLSLLSNCENIYLMREQNDSFKYMNINNLRKAIVNEWSHLFPDDITEKDVIKYYTVCCTLIGNDFIPHPLTLNVKDNAIEKIKTAVKNAGHLIVDDKINTLVLANVIQRLAGREDKDLISRLSTRTGLTEEESYIKNNPNTWRRYYYNNIVYIKSVNDACKDFLDGIHWTFNYYNKDNMHIDHGWFYPFNGAPSLKDLANYILTYEYVPCDILHDFIPVDMKLLIVIPIASIDILPSYLQKYYKMSSYGLTFMYPREYRLIKFMKEHSWEHIPCLPLIDIELLLNTLRDMEEESSE